jgi:hypothetical protein
MLSAIQRASIAALVLLLVGLLFYTSPMSAASSDPRTVMSDHAKTRTPTKTPGVCDDDDDDRRCVTPTRRPTKTPTPTNTATPTNTGTPTDTPTNTPTNTPTDTPTNTPTDTPTNTPTNTPTTIMFQCPPVDLAGRPLVDHSSTNSEIFCRYQTIPNDFFCKYFTSTGLLKQDHDEGFCPPVAVPSSSATKRVSGKG